MKRLLTSGLLLATLSTACGGPSSPLHAEIQADTQSSSEALVQLFPVLDFSEVVDESMADRVLVDEIILSVSDVRLLGLDPNLPTGGLRLIETTELIRLSPDVQEQIGFAFPEYVRRDDLAVYLSISPTPELEGASVVVRGRLYATTPPAPEEGRTRAFLADSDEGEAAVDPDDEPASPTGEGAFDPDGEPASKTGEGAVDPDGEPADCAPDQRCQGLSAGDETFLSFELQGDQTIELQAGFGVEEDLEVVLGIPAARWFTPEAVALLNQALSRRMAGEGDQLVEQERGGASPAGHMVLRDHRMGQIERGEAEGEDTKRIPGGDYSLRPGGDRGPDGVRGW